MIAKVKEMKSRKTIGVGAALLLLGGETVSTTPGVPSALVFVNTKP